jgi:hypothetical protein
VKRSIVVAALGTAQTLAWGSSYYLPAILADPIAQGLGLSRTTVFGLFSGALLLSAVLGPSVGRAIDNRGGRGVLALSNLVLAAGLHTALCCSRAVRSSKNRTRESRIRLPTAGTGDRWSTDVVPR